LIAALGKLEPGDAEEKLAGILRPQDVRFLGDDLVMAYQSIPSIFWYSKDVSTCCKQHLCSCRVRSQHLFCRAGVQWSRCTPAGMV
jgi:hypothetical protein